MNQLLASQDHPRRSFPQRALWSEGNSLRLLLISVDGFKLNDEGKRIIPEGLDQAPEAPPEAHVLRLLMFVIGVGYFVEDFRGAGGAPTPLHFLCEVPSRPFPTKRTTLEYNPAP